MCGVFGFVSKAGGRADVNRLKAIACITETRGPHAWGLAWIDPDGKLRSIKRPGRISTSLDALDRCADASMIIGHTRYATHGAAGDNHNNHPHAAGKGLYVHNGVILDYLDHARWESLNLTSDCDSEVLGAMFSARRGALADRWRGVMTTLEPGPLVMLGLWPSPNRLVMIRRGSQPLHAGGTTAGTYLASLAYGLPGKVGVIPDDHLIVSDKDRCLAKGTLPPPIARPARRWEDFKLPALRKAIAERAGKGNK